MNSNIRIRHLGAIDYLDALDQMQVFTQNRDDQTPDEIWLVEHPAVFTQGRHGKTEHILFPGDIPVVQTDRGGQVTYHGQGQAVIYFLIDLKRAKLGIKNLVCHIEKSAIEMLKTFNIESTLKEKAPGVYVSGKKICSLGLRVKQGKTYHGLSINVNMDLAPFKRINPCGYQNLEMTQISDFDEKITLEQVYQTYCDIFLKKIQTTSPQSGVSSCLL